MNKLTDIFQKIDEQQSEIDSHGQLDVELKKRINYKFRLDWNYFSNAMEGNSLTRIETKQLMMDNVTIDGKSFKDISEMRGHDEEVQEIFRVGKGEVRLSEKRIKAMHKSIMHEDDPEKKSFIGKWKTSDNHLINYKGEKFYFLSHADVPEAMHKLIDRTNADIDALSNKKKEGKHPALIAFEFHLEYVRIHPFYDGNGRTARLLTNLLLISFGYPPFLLSEKSRDSYNRVLAEIQGYGGDENDFHILLGNLLIESQELVLDAIAGKDILDDDDIDKEILLWKQGLDDEPDGLLFDKNDFLVEQAYKNSIRELFLEFISAHKVFEDFFRTMKVVNSIGNYSRADSSLGYFEDWLQYEESIKEVSGLTNLSVTEKIARFAEVRASSEETFDWDFESFKIELRFEGFKKSGNIPFDISTNLVIRFDRYRYGVFNEYDSVLVHEKLYSQTFSKGEIKEIVKEKKQWFFQLLQDQTKSKVN